jgi:hypothetical protein
LLLLPLLLIGWVVFQSQGPQRRLREVATRFPALRASLGPYPVIVLSTPALARAVAPLARRKAGFLFISSDKITLLAPSGARLVRRDFPSNESHVALINHQGISSALPSLLRLQSPEVSAYVAVSSRLGRANEEATQALYTRVAQWFPTQPFPEPRRAAAPLKRVLVGLMALLLVTATGATLWAGSGIHAPDGPSHMVELADRSVLLASRTHLYRLSASGAPLETIVLTDIGFNDGISGLQQLRRDHVLIGDYAQKRIKRCRLDGWQCKPLSGLGDDRLFLDAFSFAVDRKRSRIYASDIARHRLLEFDVEGRLIRRLLPKREFCFPNQVIVHADGVTVVNTNFHKLERFRWSHDRSSLSQVAEWLTVRQGRSDVHCPDPEERFFLRFFHRELASGSRARTFDLATPGRVWPMRAQQMNDGSWWVLNARNGMAMADVVRLAPQTDQPSLVLSGARHDPITLLARENDVLISDLESLSILRFDHAGEAKGKFGAPEFVALMESIRRAVERRQQVHFLGLLALVGTLVVALLTLLHQVRARVRWITAQDPTFR